jgi:hypothetical protein
MDSRHFGEHLLERSPLAEEIEIDLAGADLVAGEDAILEPRIWTDGFDGRRLSPHRHSGFSLAGCGDGTLREALITHRAFVAVNIGMPRGCDPRAARASARGRMRTGAAARILPLKSADQKLRRTGLSDCADSGLRRIPMK